MRLLTADEVAARYSVPRSWIYAAARRGDLPVIRLGKYRRFHPDDLRAWEEQQRLTNPSLAPRR